MPAQAYRVGRSTARDVLKRHHIEAAPERRRSGSNWRTFLNSHKAQLLATDFFTVETVWLQTVYVLFFIELKRSSPLLSSRSRSFGACLWFVTPSTVPQP